MFIYRPIGTQFIGDALEQWSRDHKAFMTSMTLRHQAWSHLPATPVVMCTIRKERE